jgi:hypothetical protein
MKTIIALLMMTSVAGAQSLTVTCRGGLPAGSDGSCFSTTGGAGSTVSTVSSSYTLVLRDKRGVTMLIRGIVGIPMTNSQESVCEFIARQVKGQDIESADCFK